MARRVAERRVLAQDDTCVHCGAEVVPIVYGFPADDAFAQVAAGKIVLGGCMMYPNAPDFACPTKGCAGA
jgi:hypothetical protein